MVCTGRYFALHSWQQSGQLWTFSGRVKVFPHILHVLVIVPRSVIRSVFRFVFSGYRSLSANSFFNHANIVFAPLISAFYCSFYCSEVNPDSSCNAGLRSYALVLPVPDILTFCSLLSLSIVLREAVLLPMNFASEDFIQYIFSYSFSPNRLPNRHSVGLEF